MKKLFLPFTVALMGLWLTGCSNDDEPSGSNSEGFISLYTTMWSSQQYMGAKIAEYHSSENSLDFTYEAPEGYSLYLVNMNKKDDKGLNIYYIEADMASVNETFVCTEDTDDSVAETITLPITISHKGSNSSGSVKTNLTIKRFKCPVVDAALLEKNWRLYTNTVIPFSSWLSFGSDGKPQQIVANISNYSDSQSSPLHISINPDGSGLLYTNTESDLPGWLYTSSAHTLSANLQNGLWKTGANPEVAVCFVNSSTIFCMAADYNNNGEMTDVHWYTLGADF